MFDDNNALFVLCNKDISHSLHHPCLSCCEGVPSWFVMDGCTRCSMGTHYTNHALSLRSTLKWYLNGRGTDRICHQHGDGVPWSFPATITTPHRPALLLFFLENVCAYRPCCIQAVDYAYQTSQPGHWVKVIWQLATSDFSKTYFHQTDENSKEFIT